MAEDNNPSREIVPTDGTIDHRRHIMAHETNGYVSGDNCAS